MTHVWGYMTLSLGAKWHKNRGLRDRGEMTGYPLISL